MTYFGTAEREEGAELIRAVFFRRDILSACRNVAVKLHWSWSGSCATRRPASQRTRLRRAACATRAARRVLVSHRQADVVFGKHLAKAIVNDGRFDVWLVVCSPALKAVPAATMPAHVRPVLTAPIIEMGLVNATGVIALMAPRAVGSAWIPYEFGRVKTGGPFAQMAAGRRRGLGFTRLPEPMLLGDQNECDRATNSDDGLTAWLDKL